MFQFSDKLFILGVISLLVSCEKHINISTSSSEVIYTDSLYVKAKRKNNDSLLNLSLKKQIKLHFKKQNWEQFNSYRLEHLSLTERLNDTFANAKTLEYSGAYFKRINMPDSSYYYYERSFEKYVLLSDSLRAGSMLLNKAIIQKNVRDYKGSEKTSFRALKFLQPSNDNRRISSAYNNLGIIYNQLQDEDLSIKYHTLAKNLRKDIQENPILYLHSINNIGKVYADNKKYGEAMESYLQILKEDSLLNTSLKLKAIVIDNYAYSRFKSGDTTNIEKDFKNALYIRDSINELGGSIINCIHLAEYYATKNDTVVALQYAKRAENLSKKTYNYRDYLESLELMSSLYKSEKAKRHFKKYIRIRDSLDLEARKQKNNFERIQFEVDELEFAIATQKKSGKINSRIMVVLFIGITILLLLYYRSNKKQQKKLEASYSEIARLKTDFVFLQSRQSSKETLNLDRFHEFLSEKYNLLSTPALMEYWKLRVERFNSREIANQLFITVDSVNDRKRRLTNKIKLVNGQRKNERNYLIDLYKTELKEFMLKMT